MNDQSTIRRRTNKYNNWMRRKSDEIESCMMAESTNTYEETIMEDGINIWVADTAATCHMGCILIGMREKKPTNTCIRVGNGQRIHGNTTGDINVTYVGLTDRTHHNIRLTNYMYSPNMKYNLYSIPYAIKCGAKVEMIDGHLEVTKGHVTLKFNRKLESGSSYLMCARMMPIDSVHHEHAMLNEESHLKPMSFMKAHYMLGHPGPRLTVSTAKKLGYKVKLSNRKCNHCGLAKSTKKDINKRCKNIATEKGEKLSIDITSSKEKSLGQNKYWLALMDEGTGMLWCEFLKSKDENSDKAYDHIMKMKGWGINLSELTIRCDNAPENYTMKKLTKRKELSIRYEFTARGTPQQNGRLERKLRTILGKTVAMLNSANLKGTLRGKLWAEAVRTATMLDNVLAKEKQLCPHEMFWGKFLNK